MPLPFHIDIVDIVFKGILIGLIASAPMGPVGVLCVQRTLNKGRWYGFITGIGAAVSDMIYALVTGYGMSFINWIFSENPKPYNSYGNGAAMRVSAVGFVANSLDEVKKLSKLVTEVSHNHPEGIKGAEATAVCIYLARNGKSISEIMDYIDKNYYPMNFTLDEIRDTYKFNETCQETVPQALRAFFESTGFEDAIRNAISIGGDSDTLAAICGGIAEAYYGIPKEIRKQALTFLDERLLNLLIEFENVYSPIIEG